MYVFYGTRHKKLYKIRGFTVKYHFVEMGDTFHGSSTAILRLAAQKLYGISAEFQQNLSDFVKFLVPCTVRTYLRIYLLLHSCFGWFHTPTHACCRVYTCMLQSVYMQLHVRYMTWKTELLSRIPWLIRACSHR